MVAAGCKMLSLQSCCLAIARSGRRLTCQSCRASWQPVSGIGRWECETTFLQAHACCMMIIPRNCSQVGDFSWSGRIGFERSASEKGRRIDRLLALESMAAVKPGRMTSKALNAVLHYQRVGTNTRLAIRISNEQSLSNNDNERRNRARSTNLTFLAREGVRGFPRTTYISEKTCHLTNLHTELHPFDSGLL